MTDKEIIKKLDGKNGFYLWIKSVRNAPSFLIITKDDVTEHVKKIKLDPFGNTPNLEKKILDVIGNNEIIEKRFEIDTKGFKEQMSEMKPFRLVQEIVSNSFDEKSVRKIVVTLRESGRRKNHYAVSVSDDGDGFIDYRDVFTLYKHSYKRSNPEQRGRFNLGEKQFFAVAETGQVWTGYWFVEFDGDTRKVKKEKRKFKGTLVSAVFKWTHEEFEDVKSSLEKLIVPRDKHFEINGQLIPHRDLIKKFKTRLRTPIENEKKKMVNVVRETEVELYQPLDDEKPWIYEIGIPVTKLLGDIPWIVNVKQKIPQSTSRDVVSEAYLKDLYSAILNNTIDLIKNDDASSTFVQIGMKNAEAPIARQILEKQYGTDKVAIESTVDSGANERAVQAGYKLVSSGELNQEVVQNLKQYEIIKYAGQEFGRNEFEFAKPVEPTEEMKFFAKVCNEVSKDVNGKHISVSFVTTKDTEEVADYGLSCLTWNVRRCGGKNKFRTDNEYLLGVLIHELAHNKYGHNNGYGHFSHEFLHEMERIAGIVALKGIQFYVDKVKQ